MGIEGIVLLWNPPLQGGRLGRGRGGIQPWGWPCTVLVVAKSAKLRFRLVAKTAPAPLRLLSPPDPLRLAPAGTPNQKTLGHEFDHKGQIAPKLRGLA